MNSRTPISLLDQDEWIHGHAPLSLPPSPPPAPHSSFIFLRMEQSSERERGEGGRGAPVAWTIQRSNFLAMIFPCFCLVSPVQHGRHHRHQAAAAAMQVYLLWDRGQKCKKNCFFFLCHILSQISNHSDAKCCYPTNSSKSSSFKTYGPINIYHM